MPSRVAVNWAVTQLRVMIGFFVVAGFIVGAVYSIDWNTVF
jgi:hypothetical protein